MTLLVNNAGVNFNTPLLGSEGTDNARREMEVNYFGTWPCAAPSLRS